MDTMQQSATSLRVHYYEYQPFTELANHSADHSNFAAATKSPLNATRQIQPIELLDLEQPASFEAQPYAGHPLASAPERPPDLANVNPTDQYTNQAPSFEHQHYHYQPCGQQQVATQGEPPEAANFGQPDAGYLPGAAPAHIYYEPPPDESFRQTGAIYAADSRDAHAVPYFHYFEQQPAGETTGQLDFNQPAQCYEPANGHALYVQPQLVQGGTPTVQTDLFEHVGQYQPLDYPASCAPYGLANDLGQLPSVEACNGASDALGGRHQHAHLEHGPSSAASMADHRSQSSSPRSSASSGSSSSGSSFSEGEESHGSSTLTRDERKAREENIPMSYSEIVNLSIEQFNEQLSRYDLSESQLTLIKDIRRRGKNKVAAQSCRKRKMEQINELQLEVDGLIVKRRSMGVECSQLIKRHADMVQEYDKIKTIIQEHQSSIRYQQQQPNYYQILTD